MKNKQLLLAICLVFFLCCNISCANASFKLKQDYVGTWSSPTEKITVRTEPKSWHFVFTKGEADFSMTIHEDKTVSGHIGNAKFENAKLVSNGGIWPVKWSGIIYTVDCGEVGKIFDKDPMEKKKLSVWICPISKEGTMEVEIRYGSFPMGGFITTKTK